MAIKQNGVFATEQLKINGTHGTFTQNAIITSTQWQLSVMAETILLVDILTLHGVSTSLNQKTLLSLVLVLTTKLVQFSLDLNHCCCNNVVYITWLLTALFSSHYSTMACITSKYKINCYRTVSQRSQGKYQTWFYATKVFFIKNKLWRHSLQHSWTRRACTPREPAFQAGLPDYLPYGLACLRTCPSGSTACSPTLRAGLPAYLLCGLAKHNWRSLWLHHVIEKRWEI